MEVKLESVVRSKLIDKQSLSISDAITDKSNQMPVVNSANDPYLCLKLSLPLSTPSFQLFHSNFFSITQYTSVDISKPSLTQPTGLRESIGGSS